MAELNVLLDTAADTAQALAAQARETAAILEQVHATVGPALAGQVDNAIAASRARLTAMGEQLDRWEGELEQAATDLDRARAALTAGADRTRASTEDFLDWLRGEIDEHLDTRISAHESEQLQRVQTNLARLDKELESLQTRDQELDEREAQMTQADAGFHAAVDAAAHAAEGAHAHLVASLERNEEVVATATQTLFAGLGALGAAVAEHAGNALATARDGVQQGDEVLHAAIHGEVTGTVLHEVQARIEDVVAQHRQQLLGEHERQAQLFELLSQMSKRYHETAMDIIQNLRS